MERRTSSNKPLRVNHLLFLNEYLANGRNGTQAYRKLHPKCSYKVAGVRACQVLKIPSVQRALAERLQAQGWDKGQAIAAVLSIRDRAATKQALDTELRAVAELNALAGLHVQRVEDITEKVSALPVAERTSRITALLTHADSDAGHVVS